MTPSTVAATRMALLLPLTLVISARDGISVTPRRLLAIGLLGVFGTGAAYVLNYRSIAELGATVASVVTYVIPVVALTVGVVFLHEAFELGLVVGGALPVGGIGLLNGWPLRPRSAAYLSPAAGH